MTDSDRIVHTAYHEAGHFVAAYALSNYGEDYLPAQYMITIKPDGESLGKVNLDDERSDKDPKIRRNALLSLYAGYYAEVRYDPDCADRAEQTSDDDFSKAKDALETLDSVEDHSLLIKKLRAGAKALVDQHWNEIELLADALLRRETIPGDEAEIIIDVARGETSLKQLTRSLNSQIREWAASLLGADE